MSDFNTGPDQADGVDEQDLLLDIEREVMGSDYGVTSFTTVNEANQMAQLLGLRRGIRLLDIGSGTGWPGLFLAGATGCHVTLVDMPESSLRAASKRAAKDGMSGNCWIVGGSGQSLPFQKDLFHAICHCDVLC